MAGFDVIVANHAEKHIPPSTIGLTGVAKLVAVVAECFGGLMAVIHGI